MAIECLVLGNPAFLHYRITAILVIPTFLSTVSVLGAGQEVGKSCVVVSMNGKRIMFDCGMDMAYQDHRRHPDFSRLSDTGDFDNAITCIVITHLYVLSTPFHIIPSFVVSILLQLLT